MVSDNRDAAAECLMTIRGRSRAGVEAELDLMASDIAASMAKTATVRRKQASFNNDYPYMDIPDWH